MLRFRRRHSGHPTISIPGEYVPAVHAMMMMIAMVIPGNGHVVPAIPVSNLSSYRGLHALELEAAVVVVFMFV